jgi:hypothetical protein
VTGTGTTGSGGGSVGGGTGTGSSGSTNGASNGGSSVGGDSGASSTAGDGASVASSGGGGGGVEIGGFSSTYIAQANSGNDAQDSSCTTILKNVSKFTRRQVTRCRWLTAYARKMHRAGRKQ